MLPDADACGVVFRVVMDAHFASHSDGLPCPSPERFSSVAAIDFKKSAHCWFVNSYFMIWNAVATAP